MNPINLMKTIDLMNLINRLGAAIAVLAICIAAAAEPAQGQPPRQERLPRNGGDVLLAKVELKDNEVLDAARLIAEVSDLNIVATEEAGKKIVTMYLENVRAIDAIETLAKVAGLWYRVDENTGTIRLMTTEEYQKDIRVFREDLTKVFTLLHPNAVSVATSIQDLYGARVILSLRTLNDDMLLGGGGGIGGGGGFGGGGFGGFGGGGFGGGGFGGGGFGGSGFGGGGFGGGGFGGGGFGGGGFGGGGGALAGFGTGFGGGAGGFGGRGGFGAGGSAFSRPGIGGGMGGFGGPGGFGGGFGRQRTQILDETLTPEQIVRLEERIDLLEDAEGRIPEEALREVTQGEPLIYVTFNSQHNLVIVRTSDAEAMAAIERLVQEIDRPTPQVLLEMKIVELTLDDNFRSIFDLQFAGGQQGPTAAEQVQRNPFLTGAATAAEVAGGLGNFGAEGGTFVYQFLNDQIRARIQMLEEERRLNTVATPLLLASNNRPARIFVGEERVLTRSVSTNIISPGTGATTTAVTPVTEIRDIGTTLFLIPKINADRTVTLVISQDSSSVNRNATTIPVATEGGGIQEFAIDTVNTRNIFGTVVAKDGLTVAIGGLIREEVIRTQQKVPVLGDLPIVGRVFRREFNQDLKTELILLITPHVVMTPTEGEARTHSRLRDLSHHPAFQCSPEAPVVAPEGPLPESHFEPTVEILPPAEPDVLE